MLKSRLVPLVMAAAGLFAAPAHAGVAAGDTEIGIFGQISSDNENDTTTMIMGGNLGKFMTDNLEVKGTVSMTSFEDAAGNGATTLFFGGGGDLALGGAKATFVPYIGAVLNLTTLAATVAGNDITGVGVTLDLHIGGKIFITERASLDLQLRQVGGTISTEDSFGNTSDKDINNTDFLIGINIYM